MQTVICCTCEKIYALYSE